MPPTPLAAPGRPVPKTSTGASTSSAHPSPASRRGTSTPSEDLEGLIRVYPRRGWGVPVLYVILIVLIDLEIARLGISVFATDLLIAILLIYLLRDLSIVYTVDTDHLNAWRLFGWRRVPLDSIRLVERRSLRELAPVGIIGTWGWRSRLWSPREGRFDAIHTFHDGLLVHGEGVPLFISPRDPDGFARLLNARAPGLASDEHAPLPTSAP